MSSDDGQETFNELSAEYPDLMRTLLQASVSAFVNVQSLEAVDAELQRRALDKNG